MFDIGLYQEPTPESEEMVQNVFAAQTSSTVASVIAPDRFRIALAVAAFGEIAKGNPKLFKFPEGDGKLDVNDPASSLGKASRAAVRNLPEFMSKIPTEDRNNIRALTAAIAADVMFQANAQKMHKGMVDWEYRMIHLTSDQQEHVVMLNKDPDKRNYRLNAVQIMGKGDYHDLTSWGMRTPAKEISINSKTLSTYPILSIADNLQTVADKRGNGMLGNTLQEYAVAAGKNKISQDGKIVMSIDESRAKSPSINQNISQQAMHNSQVQSAAL